MLGTGIFRGVAFAAMEVGEALIKNGGNATKTIRGVSAGGILTGNFRAGMTSAATGLGPWGLGLGGLFGIAAAANAPRGQTLSKGFAVASSTTIADVLGGALGGPIGQVIAQATIARPLQAMIEKPIKAFQEFHHNVTHLNMGGNYQDTEIAYTMRQRAALEMNGSLLNARRYLGSEANLLHQ